MHCSACAARIERALGRLPGVASASVNLATARAFVSYNGSAISAGELCQTVADVGYSAEAVDAAAGSARREHSDRWVLRAIICWPLAIAALLVSLLLPRPRARAGPSLSSPSSSSSQAAGPSSATPLAFCAMAQ